MKTHELKTVAPHFEDIVSGAKRVEIRREDRGFAIGDILLLREYDAERNSYSGRESMVRVTHILSYYEALGAGYVAMSIELTGEMPQPKDQRSSMPWIEGDDGSLKLRIGPLQAVVAHYSEGDYVWWLDERDGRVRDRRRVIEMSHPDSKANTKNSAERALRDIHAAISLCLGSASGQAALGQHESEDRNEDEVLE